MFEHIMRKPDNIMVETQESRVTLQCKNETTSLEDIIVSIDTKKQTSVDIFVTAEKTPIKTICFRWNGAVPSGCRFLCDAWERSYGDLEWRGLVPNRVMPWYFLINKGEQTACYGVKVRPAALCFFQADEKGVSLWMDLRNGGKGVVLGGRKLKICTVVNREYDGVDAYHAAQQFCSLLCDNPILPQEPVYGFNNWYSSYGDISAEQVVEDSRELHKLLGDGCKNRPFMVIDDGWQIAHKLNVYNGGPWYAGNEKFPDMKALAQKIKEQNCKPGIWVRLLHTSDETLPEAWRLKKNHSVLDPSVPEVLDDIKQTIGQITDWGYTLIKHDFSTNDLFDCWGFQMNPSVPDGDWGFADQSKTTAEIIIGLYEAILEGAGGKAYIMGCNCIGHLGAGLMHLQRIGDDVSGLCWERTRRYGINTLAFRLPQHKTFFDIDADCVGVTSQVPWEYNKQWADLIGKSGTPLFVSAKLQELTEEQRKALRALLERNARQTDSLKPLDWMETTCPQRWERNGKTVQYDWYEETGVSAFVV